MPDAGQSHGIHGICIAVLKGLVTMAGIDNGTKLANVFLVFTGSPLVSSSVCYRRQFTGSTIECISKDGKLSLERELPLSV